MWKKSSPHSFLNNLAPQKGNLFLQLHHITANSSAEVNWGAVCAIHLTCISDCGIWLDLKPPRKITEPPQSYQLSPRSTSTIVIKPRHSPDWDFRSVFLCQVTCIPKPLASLLSRFLLLTTPWLYSSSVHILLSVSAAFTPDHLCFDFTHHHRVL